MHIVRSNIHSVLYWYQGVQFMPRTHSQHHYTTDSSSCWHKASWTKKLVLFTPNSYLNFHTSLRFIRIRRLFLSSPVQFGVHCSLRFLFWCGTRSSTRSSSFMFCIQKCFSDHHYCKKEVIWITVAFLSASTSPPPLSSLVNNSRGIWSFIFMCS